MEAPSTLPWSFINGYSVPHVLHPKQVAVLFPNGLLGLRQVLPSECGEPVYVYPNEEGSFSLKAGEVYTTSKFVGQDEEVPPSTIPCHISAAVASVLPIAKTINHTGVLGGHLTVSDGSSSELLPRVYACTPNRSPTSEKEPLTAVADCRSPPPMQFFDPVDSAEHINTTHSLSHIAGKSPEMCATTNQKIEPCDGLSQTYRREGKLIQDRVHGHISLPMLAFDIIDTLEYQRLRNIKQLGTTVLLYPGATHTRFEHCIGVAHMASEMVKHFARHQPELEINQADVLCVTIAGLCHDLGHGPFSHLFEHTVGRFAANLQYGASFHTSRYKREARTRWNHEEMSIKLIRRIFERLKANMERSGLTDADRLFIELCVKGLLPIDSWPKNVGRDEKKRFLVEIVANKRHGIDVDKLDYFLRDSLGVYGRPAADIHFPRILSASRVMKYGGQYQICFEVKLALNLGDIFAVRAKLHKYVYQHRIVKVTDYMVSDALCQSTKDFFVRGKDGKEVSLSSCAYDVEGFISLGDWILNAISASTNPKLAGARDIIDRLQRRKLYTIVDDVPFKSETDPRREMMATRMTGERVAKELLDIVEGLLPKRDNNNNNNAAVLQRIEASLIVSFTNITYGSYDVKQVPDDPISKVIFFNPKQMHMGPFKLPAERISPLFQPIAFSDRSMLVLMRDTTHRDLVERACEEWRGKHSDSISVAVPSSNVCSQSKEHSTPQMKRAREPEENDGVLIRGVAPRV